MLRRQQIKTNRANQVKCEMQVWKCERKEEMQL